jgi:hypothetical protein
MSEKISENLARIRGKDGVKPILLPLADMPEQAKPEDAWHFKKPKLKIK